DIADRALAAAVAGERERRALGAGEVATVAVRGVATLRSGVLEQQLGSGDAVVHPAVALEPPHAVAVAVGGQATADVRPAGVVVVPGRRHLARGRIASLRESDLAPTPEDLRAGGALGGHRAVAAGDLAVGLLRVDLVAAVAVVPEPDQGVARAENVANRVEVPRRVAVVLGDVRPLLSGETFHTGGRDWIYHLAVAALQRDGALAVVGEVAQVAQAVPPDQQARGALQVDAVGELALAQVDVADRAPAAAVAGERERRALRAAEAARVAVAGLALLRLGPARGRLGVLEVQRGPGDAIPVRSAAFEPVLAVALAVIRQGATDARGALVRVHARNGLLCGP